MDDKDFTVGDLDQLRTKAQQSVKKDGDLWRLDFDKPVQGIDTSKTYSSQDQAIEAAFNALKSQSKPRVA